MIDDETVLITGGTGTFGRALIKKILRDYNAKKIIVYSRDEFKQFNMMKDLDGFPGSGSKLRFFIGDVRDKERLNRAMYGVNIVFHAAALKQIPICEYNPFEAVKTNIYGAQNIIDCAIENGVSKVIALSSDKAVNPINLYGATKLVSEKLFIEANTFGHNCTKFCCVRYGNVLGSRGSVVQEFKKQAQSGTIYITSREMTRFWWSVDDAIIFVLNALLNMQGGEIFVPKLKSTTVRDLAVFICPECRVKCIGLRPGEKLFETLIAPDEVRRTDDVIWAYCIVSENKFFKFEDTGLYRVDKHFVYNSDNCIHEDPDIFFGEILARG